MKLSQRLRSTSKFNPLVMGLYGLIIGAAGYLIVVSRAAPAPPTVYLSPASQTLAVNTTFTVQVRENSGTTNVNAVEAHIDYPASLVDFVSVSTSGSAYDVDVQATGANGSVTIARGKTPPTLTGDQLVATITFKTKATGGTANMAFTTGTSLVSSPTSTNLITSLSSTAGGSYVIDATAPTVSLAAPAPAATISAGSTTVVSATANDNTTVSKVEILIDGVIKATLTTNPYNYSWNTTGLPLGSHTVQARASDPYGNTASTPIVTVTLADITAPTVSITSPSGAQPINVSGTVTINATSSDNVGGTGVNKVEFYIDGTLKLSDAISPYSYSWDTKTTTDGSHSLTAKSYDKATVANVTTSSAVAVNVDNADHAAPSTPANFRSTTQNLNSITLAWGASTDNVGVTGYRIKRDGVTVTTTTSLTYTDSSLTTGTAYDYNIVALDAAGNPSIAATLNASTLPIKEGDINGDGKVDLVDLSNLLTNWATTNALADLNHNGLVDIYDLSILLTNYGT